MEHKSVKHKSILIRPLEKSISDLLTQIKKLDKELKRLMEENEANLFYRLQTIPGIGKSTAIFMIVLSDGFKEFEITKQFTCCISH